MEVFFTIHGEPVAQGRPRFSTRGGVPRAYDPENSRNYKELVGFMAKTRKKLEGALVVEIDVYRSIPKSFNKTNRQLAMDGDLFPTQKPDVDNYSKAIMDGMNGITFDDDSQIVALTVTKSYSDIPRVEVTVTELN